MEPETRSTVSDSRDVFIPGQFGSFRKIIVK